VHAQTRKINMDRQQTNFSKYGLIIGALLILTEYVLYYLFFSYANPDLWENKIPHKYYFYITFLIGTIILIVILFRQKLKEEITNNYENFSEFKINIGRVFGFAIFGLGTYIVYYILKARIFDEFVIFQFVDNNLYVNSASESFAVINQIAYPIILTFIYQGFLLSGLSKLIGYQKSTILTSVFYGYWSQSIIGGTALNLFMNHVFKESKNIFYPILLSIILNLTYTLGYIIKPEIWLLKADSPIYNDELIKGLILTVIGLPIVIPTMIKIFKK
jgi:hypothetical protein